MSNIIFKDTFSGAAGTSLAGRTPDVGPAWGTVTGIISPIQFIYEDGVANLGMFEVDGSGGMWYANSENQRYDLTVPVSVPGNGYFEMKFTLTDPGPGGFYTLYFGGALDVPIINGVPSEEDWGMNTPDISLRFERDSGFLQSYYGSDGTAANGIDVLVAIPVVYGAEYTWRWNITPAGFFVTLSDGTNTVTTVSDTGYAALPHWPNVEYGLGNFGQGFYLDSFKDNGSGAAVPFSTIGTAPAKVTSIEVGKL